MTAKAVSALAKKIGASVPLTDAVNKMIDGAPVSQLLTELFDRPIKSEF